LSLARSLINFFGFVSGIHYLSIFYKWGNPSTVNKKIKLFFATSLVKLITISYWFGLTSLSSNLQKTSSNFIYKAFFDELSGASSAEEIIYLKILVTFKVKKRLLSLKISYKSKQISGFLSISLKNISKLLWTFIWFAKLSLTYITKNL